MYVWSIALVALLLSGCVDPRSPDKLTPQQMRVAIDECRDLDLRAVLIHDGFGNQRIECRPAKEEQ